MPKVKEHMANAEGIKGSDIKGKKVTVYRLEKLYPFNDKTSDFAHLSLIDKDSSQEYYTWYYSVIVYKDGSCRFTVDILPNWYVLEKQEPQVPPWPLALPKRDIIDPWK